MTLLGLALGAGLSGCPGSDSPARPVVGIAMKLTLDGPVLLQNDPRTLHVQVYTLTAPYVDGGIPLPGNSVTPDTLDLTLDGVSVPFDRSTGSYRWDTTMSADGIHVFHASATWHGFSASGEVSWTLDRRVPTIQPYGQPIWAAAIGTGGGNDVAVGFSSDGTPLMLSTFVNAPNEAVLVTLSRWDAGDWQSATIETGEFAVHPSLAVTSTGAIWAAFDDSPHARIERFPEPSMELVDGGPQFLFPRLATASGLVAVGSLDRQSPLRILDGGIWELAGPALPVDPTAVRATLDPNGTPYLAVEHLEADGWFVRVIKSEGGEWRQLGGDLPAEPWDGGTLYPPRHLVDLVIDGLSRPVVAFMSENASLSVLRWEGASWTTLGTPRGRYDPFNSDFFTLDRAQGAMSTTPDGGVALLYLSASSTLTLELWDEEQWRDPYGPLREGPGSTFIFTPSLAFDARGRPLAAWHQYNPSKLHAEVVAWRP